MLELMQQSNNRIVTTKHQINFIWLQFSLQPQIMLIAVRTSQLWKILIAACYTATSLSHQAQKKLRQYDFCVSVFPDLSGVLFATAVMADKLAPNPLD